MPKLTDSQLVILSAAAQRDDRRAFPFPKSMKLNKAAAGKVVGSLIRKSLLMEQPTGISEETWREEGDGQRLTLAITDQGMAAIGLAAEAPKSKKSKKANPTAPAKLKAGKGKKGTKQDGLLEILRRPGGAGIEDLQKATGWLPHTVRAAITGLRKKGLKINLIKKEGEASVYRAVKG